LAPEQVTQFKDLLDNLSPQLNSYLKSIGPRPDAVSKQPPTK
jgi:hypothetical protein